MGTRGAQNKFRAASHKCRLTNFAGKKLIWRKDWMLQLGGNVAPQARQGGPGSTVLTATTKLRSRSEV